MVVIFVWFSFVLLLSVIPTKDVPTGHPTDKIIHFIIYGITAILLMKNLRSKMSLKKSAVLSLTVASLFGLIIELIQAAIPWRECSFSDMIANVAGAVSFSFLYALMDYYRKKI